MIQAIRARDVRCVVLTGATPADLETALNAWLAAAQERMLVDVQCRYDQSGAGDKAVAIVFYTE